EVSFTGPGAGPDQRVMYITERAVFALVEGAVTLIEVAEGIDVEGDVLAHMDFEPAVADPLGTIDPRVFAEGPMGLASAYGSTS
ncbi:MAG TPA: acyl CoA:acetate/3-ketoacid CoA transferase, partial [Acidimicrobiia bacterium]|nr:acyl CoA:acetate/3-ketoacid CoA transferase [Acidimicrobiia bacterium]